MSFRTMIELLLGMAIGWCIVLQIQIITLERKTKDAIALAGAPGSCLPGDAWISRGVWYGCVEANTWRKK